VAALRDQLAQIYHSAGATLVDVKAVDAGREKAFRSDVTLPFKNPDGTTISESIGQLVIPGATSSTVVTVTSSDDASGAAVIDEILGTVRPL
jgi:hypothetical protein